MLLVNNVPILAVPVTRMLAAFTSPVTLTLAEALTLAAETLPVTLTAPMKFAPPGHNTMMLPIALTVAKMFPLGLDTAKSVVPLEIWLTARLDTAVTFDKNPPSPIKKAPP